MADRTNQEWLEALRGSGRDDALSDLRGLLVRGLRHALPDVPQQSLEDTVQEALLKILAGLDTFRGESRFTTWAFRIAIHEAFTELRRRRWRNISLQDLVAKYDEGDFTPTVLADCTFSPEQRVTQQMLLEIVWRLIGEELTERQRVAMIAVVFEGMSGSEVARRMGTNRNALYKLMHDARQRLKRQLLASGLSVDDVMEAFEA